jgi:hypothetical protein
MGRKTLTLTLSRRTGRGDRRAKSLNEIAMVPDKFKQEAPCEFY